MFGECFLMRQTKPSRVVTSRLEQCIGEPGRPVSQLDVMVLLLTELSELGKDVWSREWSRVTSLLDHWIRDIKGPDVEDAAKTG